MSWLFRLINVFRADRVSDEIDREMKFHLGERTDDLIAGGLPEARRRFGSVALASETTRERDVFVWVETFLSDLRYGLRGLARDPVFCVTAILTLAIGIGANTADFSLLHGLLLRSLPVSAPQDLVRIDLDSLTDPRASEGMPYGMQQQLRASSSPSSTCPSGSAPASTSPIRMARCGCSRPPPSVATRSRRSDSARASAAC